MFYVEYTILNVFTIGIQFLRYKSDGLLLLNALHLIYDVNGWDVKIHSKWLPKVRVLDTAIEKEIGQTYPASEYPNTMPTISRRK